MAGGSVYCRLRLPRNLWGFGDAMQFAKVALRRPVGPSWRSLAHWASASLLPPLAALGFAPRRLSSDLAAQGELSRRDKRRPPGGCASNPQKALRSRGFPAWLPARAVGARAPWKSRKGGVKPLFRQGVAAAYSAAFFLCKGRKKQPSAFGGGGIGNHRPERGRFEQLHGHRREEYHSGYASLLFRASAANLPPSGAQRPVPSHWLWRKARRTQPERPPPKAGQPSAGANGAAMARWFLMSPPLWGPVAVAAGFIGP